MRNVFILGLISLFFACSHEKSDKSEAENAIEAEKKASTAYSIDSDELKQLIQSIPPSIQVADMISSKGYKYNTSFLHDADKVNNYQGSYNQAFFLGVYGADLGYTQMYNQAVDGMVYFNALFKLANELKIEQFFDRKLLQKLTKLDNIDSLLIVSMDNLQQINSHLIEEKNPQLSALIVMGSWLESTYLMAQSYKVKSSPSLKERIAEQSVSLDIIEEILSKYEGDTELVSYKNQLQPIFKAFGQVQVVENELSETAEHVWNENGTMTIKPSVESVTIVSDDAINDIVKQLIEVRSKIIQ